MNPDVEVEQLLRENHAVLVRQNNHFVYRLPNGQNFVAAKTPSDHHAAMNNVHALRRALGIESTKTDGKGDRMPFQEEAVATQAPRPTPVPVSEEPLKEESFRQRVEAAIAVEEQHQERVLADAQAVERRVNMLKAILPFADDPTIEESLRGILPAVRLRAREPALAQIAEPPRAITRRIQVTRQLVFAATQTFASPFTVNDVMALMTGGTEIEGAERLRVRSSIAQAMVTLNERGELIKAEEHYGKKQTIWRKAELKSGSGVGTRA